MRHKRNLSDEQVAMLSAPVERPTPHWDSFQAAEALEPPRPGFESLEPRLSDFNEGKSFLEGTLEVGATIGSFFRLPDVGGQLYDLFTGQDKATWFTEEQRNVPGSAWEGLTSLREIVRHPERPTYTLPTIHGGEIVEPGRVLTTGGGATEEQQIIGQFFQDVGVFAQSTFMNPYDPANVGVFDPLQTVERMPALGAAAEYVEGASPITAAGEYNPYWSENLSEAIREESGELLLEIGLGAVLGGAGVASGAVRRGVGAVHRGIRSSAADIRMEGLLDFGELRRAATVELDLATRQGFRQSGVGGVIADPKTGQIYISTAAHVVTGQRGQPLDFAGIRATTGTGEIGTVQGVSAIDLERDIALLQVTGLTETLNLPDFPLSGSHTLLGRQGMRTDARIVGDSGAAIETTTAVGVAGESGAPLISGVTDIAGLYLGTLDQPGAVTRGMYADADAISALIGQVGDSRVRLGRELSKQAYAQGLHHRITRGDADVRIEGQDLYARGGVGVFQEVPPPTILLPQFQMAQTQVHSRDDEWRSVLSQMFAEQDDVSLPFSAATPFSQLFSEVSADPDLFFYVGRRGQDISGLGFLDQAQTERYREWVETRAPWDEFPLYEGAHLIPPGQVTTPSGQRIDRPYVSQEGVFGFRDVTELGRALREDSGLARDQFSLQIGRGIETADVHRRFGMDRTSSAFYLDVESLLELDLPDVAGLRNVFQEIRESGGQVRQFGIDEPTEVGVQWSVGPSGLFRPEIKPTIPRPRAPREDYSRLTTMPEAELQEWIAAGQAAPIAGADPVFNRWVTQADDFSASGLGWVKQSREELWRRRLSHPSPTVRREYERWKRLDDALAADRAEDTGLSFEHDVAAREYSYEAVGYTTPFERQIYRSEAWESPAGPGPEDTGKYYEGYEDAHGDYMTEEDLAEERLVTVDTSGDYDFGEAAAGGEEWLLQSELGSSIVRDPWVEERGVYDDLGQVHGDDVVDDPSIIGGKVGYRTGPTGIGLQPETVEQLGDVLSGFIDKYDRAEWIEQNPAAFRSIVMAEIRQGGNLGDLPRGGMMAQVAGTRFEPIVGQEGWLATYNLASRRAEDLRDPDRLGSYYQQAVSEQPEGWEQGANELWVQGRFKEFHDYLHPVYRSASRRQSADFQRYQEYRQQAEPGWKQALREVEDDILERQGVTLGGRWLSSTEQQMLRQYDRMARRRGQFQIEGHPAMAPRIDFDEPSMAQEAPVEVRQLQAQVLEASAFQDPLTRLPDFESSVRHQIYREVAEADSIKRYGVNLAGVRVGDAVQTDPRGFAEGWHGRDAAEQRLFAETQAGRRLQEYPTEEVTGDAENLAELREAASLRLRQELDSVKNQYYARMRDEPENIKALQEELRGEIRRIQERSADIFGKTETHLHSIFDPAPEPLDLETPRARLSDFRGIQSDRTYGLEIELITDLTRAEMERELEWEMGQGLALKYDLSLRTARSEVAIEHHPPAGSDRDIQRVEAADYLDMAASYTGDPGGPPLGKSAYDTRYAHELVFPVMRGEQDFSLIEDTVKVLRQFETEFNTSMGMHIHVGAQDLTNYDLVGVWGAFAARESTIDLMHEPSRRGAGSDYASTLYKSRATTLGEIMRHSEIMRDSVRERDLAGIGVSERERLGARLDIARRTSLLSDASRESFLDQVGYGSRYQKLNLRGYKHQTIEYRQPAPTLNLDEIYHHIGFITDFVDEFAGTGLDWAFRQDPRLQSRLAGMDLTFERPDDTGQLLMMGDSDVYTEVHSVDLTASQREAMSHTYGPAVVMAGPGSGKSRTLIERLRYLSEEGLATSNDVLTLVFGKEAQLDLTERASELGGDWNIFTVDAFARSMVRENFGQLGYTRAPDIVQTSFEDWLGEPGRLQEFGASVVSEDIAKSWAQQYEKTRRELTQGREDYSGLEPSVQQAIRSFRMEKFGAGQMDFTDAIAQAGYLLESNEGLRRRYQERFKFLQVDEFQDVSPLQGRLIRNLSENPWVVGDLDQGIMGFRGGTGTVMRQMIQSGASLYRIGENFRSTPEIVGAAQGFIQPNLGRIPVHQQAVKPPGEDVQMIGVTPLTTEQEAISRLAEQVREGEETAILTRTRRERDVIESELGVELRGRGWEDEEIENLLTFETMHASKGREWENVILPVNILESDFGNRQRLFTLPSPYAKTAMDFAEEERLFYVGMTRAQERLTIMGDPSHPYFEAVGAAISGRTEGGAPSYIGDIVDPMRAFSEPKRPGGLGALLGRMGERLDRLLHGDPLKHSEGLEAQRRAVQERRRGNKTKLHSIEGDRFASEHIMLSDHYQEALDRGYLTGSVGRSRGLLYFSEGAHFRMKLGDDKFSYGFFFDPEVLENEFGAVASSQRLNALEYQAGKDLGDLDLLDLLKVQRDYEVFVEPEFVVQKDVPLSKAIGISEESGIYWIDPSTRGDNPNRWDLWPVESEELGGREPGSFSSVQSLIIPSDVQISIHSQFDSDELNALINEMADEQEANIAEFVPNVVRGVPDEPDFTEADYIGPPVAPLDLSEWASGPGGLELFGDMIGDMPFRGRGIGLSDRLTRRMLEASTERSWGEASGIAAEMARNSGIINVFASLTVEGMRTFAGHDLNVGSLMHAGASALIGLGTTALDARIGSRGVLPETRYDLASLAGAVENVPEGAGTHLQQIFRAAGAGTARWSRGSLSNELSRYSMGDLETMFGASGAEYVSEFAYQSRRFGQRSHQTQRNWPETILGIYSGDIPKAMRYAYDPGSRNVDVQYGRRWNLDRLIEEGAKRFVPLEGWRARREYLRENPQEDRLRYLFGPLQPEDATPHVGYMMLPESRGIGRFFGRFHAEPSDKAGRTLADDLESFAGRVGATGWAERIAGRADFRRERAAMLEDRRRSPELYQWQDPEHFYEVLSEGLGISEQRTLSTVDLEELAWSARRGEVEDFTQDIERRDSLFGRNRLVSPYSRWGRFGSRLPAWSKRPLQGAGGLAVGYTVKELFFGEDEPDEQLVLDDPAGYSVSPRYPILGAVQQTRPFRRLRARGENLLDDVFGEDTIHSEMMKSMLLGKKRNLPKDVKETFVQTGQIHTLVQSGMHVSMFSNILSRFPLLAAPAALSAARDTIAPPDETVVEPSQSYWSKYQLSPDPWAPRFNPELPSSIEIQMLKSEGLLPEDYELEIPDPPFWGWWDPVANYERDEARFAQTLATSPQIEMLRAQGLLPEGYDVSQHERKQIQLRRGQPGIQDVIPWTIYGMFGVIPEASYSYFRSETGREETEEGYKIDGFEFDVHESPHPGFNPWLDPTPEGFTGLPDDNVSFRGIPLGRIGSEVLDFTSEIYQQTDPDESLNALYKRLGIEMPLTQKDINKLMEYRKEQGGIPSESAFGFMHSLRSQVEGLPPHGLIAYEDLDFDRPRIEWNKLEVSSGIWHLQQRQKAAREAKAEDASSGPSESAFGLMQSLYSQLEGLPPPNLIPFDQLDINRPREQWTQAESSSMIWHLQQRLGEQRGSTDDTPSIPSESAFGLMQSLYSQLEGLPPPNLVPFDQLDINRPREQWTQAESSSMIWHLQQRLSEQRGSADADDTPSVPSESAFGLMQSLYSQLEGLPPPNLIPFDQLDINRPREQWTQTEMSSAIWHLQQRRAEREANKPEQMMSEDAYRFLQSLNPDRYGEPAYDVMPIEDIVFEDGLSTAEGAALIDYEQAVKKSEGPELASDAMMAELRRRLPQFFKDIPAEEKPLKPLHEIEFKDKMLRSEAQEAFRHLPQLPPPLATPAQVELLQRRFPHAFQRVGRADQYLESGQSYGIVRSIEDIYDADTFTGMLFDAESGQTFQHDTVRLGDFDAPEIRPDPLKPREYQLREAARAREARDVFRSLVQRFNVGRDVEQEGYVVPIQFRHDARNLGGLERGSFGRVLGDVNFQGMDYEQFMIQQGMGSVYGASVEWGEEEINPLSLWRRTPTYMESVGEDATNLLWQVPESIVGGVLSGADPAESVIGTFQQIPGALKDIAVGRAKQTVMQATKDFFKERFTDEFTPNTLPFAQRYIGDFTGVGDKVSGFFQSGLGAAVAPIALAAGTAVVGERSLDANYAEVVASADDRKQSFEDVLDLRENVVRSGESVGASASAMRVIKQSLREVLVEAGLGSMQDLTTALSRKMRESDTRGITRAR